MIPQSYFYQWYLYWYRYNISINIKQILIETCSIYINMKQILFSPLNISKFFGYFASICNFIVRKTWNYVLSVYSYVGNILVGIIIWRLACPSVLLSLSKNVRIKAIYVLRRRKWVNVSGRQIMWEKNHNQQNQYFEYLFTTD